MNFSAQYRRTREYEGHADSIYSFRSECDGFQFNTPRTGVYPAVLYGSAQTGCFDPLSN